MVGLYYLFLEPNAEDPLNKGSSFISLLSSIIPIVPLAEAAEDLRRNRDKFIYNVKVSMRGGNVNGTTYDTVTVK